MTASLCACVAPTSRPAPVPPTLRVDGWTGSPLSGPIASDPIAEDVEWRWVGVRARTLSQTWAAGSTDVDSSPASAFATLIRKPGSPAAFEATSTLAEWVRLSPASRALWANELGPENAAWFALAPGTTIALAVGTPARAELELMLGLNDAAESLLALDLSRADEQARLRLDVAPDVDGATLSTLLPSWPTVHGSDPLVLRVRVTSTLPPSVDEAALIAQARTLYGTVDPPAVSVETPHADTQPNIPWPSLAHALGGVDHPATQRGSLIYLAAASGARLTEEIGLTARASLLRPIGRAVAAMHVSDAASLGLALETATAATLADQSELADDIYAIALQWAGAAGDDIAVIAEFTAGVDSLDELDALLVMENIYELDSTSPSARLRAYEWLQARGRAPADFPVFGTSAERRAVLQAWEQAP